MARDYATQRIVTQAELRLQRVTRFSCTICRKVSEELRQQPELCAFRVGGGHTAGDEKIGGRAAVRRRDPLLDAGCEQEQRRRRRRQHPI